MSNTLRIALIILVGAALIFAIWFGFRAFQPSNDGPVDPAPDQNTNLPTDTVPVNDTRANLNVDVPVETPPADGAVTEVETGDEESVLRLARIFTERFGTFSNRNNFENITNLEPFMTQRMQQEQAQYIDDNQNSGIEQEYYGITTTVASMELVSFEEGGDAQARLQTRRVESKAQQDPTVFTQSILVNFKNVSGNWKVDSTRWE